MNALWVTLKAIPKLIASDGDPKAKKIREEKEGGK
jgi:hypothetical protein